MNQNLEVAYIAITDVIPYANNPRTHSEQQVAQVAASIKEFGFNNPILLDEHNGIIAGHGRLAAAQKLGMDLVPTITLAGLTEAQRKAYVIADNKLTENGGWDYDLLAVEIERLAELDIDLSLTGLDEIELAKMFDEPQEPVVQEVDYAESFSVVVECSDEAEQEKVFNRLDSEGYKCRVQSL